MERSEVAGRSETGFRLCGAQHRRKLTLDTRSLGEHDMGLPRLKLLNGDDEHPFDVGLTLTLAAALVSAAIAAGLIASMGLLLDIDAKGAVAIATALAGFATVAVGLALSIDAYRGLRSAVNPKQTTPAPAASTTEVKVAGLLGLTSADLSTLLPQLIRTAAGIAIAVLLLGCLLLATASVTSPSSASAAPTPNASPAALVQP